MCSTNAVGAFEICNGTRHLEDLDQPTRGKAELVVYGFQQAVTVTVGFGQLPGEAIGHFRVGQNIGAAEPLGRGLPRAHYPVAHRRRRFSAAGPHFTVAHGRHFDVQIDAVEQRPAEPVAVARDCRQRAGAVMGGVTQVTARASEKGTETNGWKIENDVRGYIGLNVETRGEGIDRAIERAWQWSRTNKK